jgi:VCBS repeat-containing protein
VELVPPTVADDVGATDAIMPISGNVLANDDPGLAIVAVNGLAANIGQTITGSGGGQFVINTDGSWTFNPSGAFAALTGEQTATTSVTYHASDGVAEAMGTLTVTVSAAPSSGVHFIFDGSAYSAPLFNAVNFVFEVE